MTIDDSNEFAEAQHEFARRLAANDELQRTALAAVRLSDINNYSYVWRWLGVPIIQMPTDVVAVQEVIWSRRPTVIIETGVARGGSAILHASILQLLGQGIVIGIDVDIRAHNRRAVETHEVSDRIRLVEGSSTEASTLGRVRELISPDDRVMVVLDSDHTHDHVLRELRAYGPLVTRGQFLVVADTIVEYIPPNSSRPRSWGPGNNPKTAVDSYLAECDRFVVDDINLKLLMSSSPGGYLRCVSP